MTRVAVSESVLRWALERSGRAAEIQKKFAKLSEWLEGISRPTLRQLEALARETATPFGYFFLTEPPEERLPIPHFRTLGGESARRPSPDLLETVQTMELRQAWMREYLIEQGQEPLPFVRAADLRDEPRRIAQEIRSILGFPETWAAGEPTWEAALRELMRRSEEAGILVVANGVVGNNNRRKLDPAEFRGFVLVDEYAPLVFLNGADYKAAQIFTLAHELAHVWFGHSAAFDLREFRPAEDPIEQACNRVAAEFLVPESRLRELWPHFHRAPEPFEEIARHFKVSRLVALRRAFEMDLITRKYFFECYRNYREDEHRKPEREQEGGNFYANQNLRIGRRFAETVIRAAREGRILYREAYRLTGLYGKAFEKYAEILGLGASP
ncbi:MAG: ImmA/IrrE family metallo-endopeptidase [Firmicutes bacterium]|nr:ImmA/IrrE family metallo-endopeptidase [Bacillota bacterium]